MECYWLLVVGVVGCGVDYFGDVVVVVFGCFDGLFCFEIDVGCLGCDGIFFG